MMAEYNSLKCCEDGNTREHNRQSMEEQLCLWEIPAVGTVKINCDAAWDARAGQAKLGLIA